MSERDNLLVSIANTIQTYRSGELPQPDAAHVDRWASQFTPANQLPFLREFDHVIKKTFLTKDSISHFLRNLVTNKKLAGSDPRAYWARANVLNIQGNGQSQTEMVKLFADALRDECGLELAKCGAEDGDYIYLDDVIFGGGRVGSDLGDWIQNNAPRKANVHVIVMAYHMFGQYSANNRLQDAVRESKKNIQIQFWRLFELENRRYRKDQSQVLWPASVPKDAATQAYVDAQTKFPLELRKPGGPLGMFSSEAGRQALETEFLIAGVKIRGLTGNLKDWYRPLGCGSFGVGFGALIATYRNCPNNSPLAMWWGDPDDNSGALHWYPLLSRQTYAAPVNVFKPITF